MAADIEGDLLVLNAQGGIVRGVPSPAGDRRVQGLELSRDRTRAFVALLQRPGESTDLVAGPEPSLERIYEVALPTGRGKEVARGISPALSPDGGTLAYWRGEIRNGITYRTAVVVRGLASADEHIYPLGESAVFGTPPEMVINWAPDGRRIAVVGARLIRILDLDSDQTVAGASGVPGETFSPARQRLLAPVFLDDERLVALDNCCIGRQRLVEIDLTTGHRRLYATVVGPPESIRRTTSGGLLVATAALRLVRIENGEVKELRRGIVAADE